MPDADLEPQCWWGAEGIRVDLVDPEGRTRVQWSLTWSELADQVGGVGNTDPTVRSSPGGLLVLARTPSKNLRWIAWGWADLAERAKLQGTPIDP